MKYLKKSMSVEEARKEYHKLSLKLHPDIGGDADAFKILTNEYLEIKRSAIISPEQEYEALMGQAGIQLNTIAETLNEIYPRTKIRLNYTLRQIDVAIHGKVPMRRMLHIEEIVNSFKYPFTVYMFFRWNEGTKWYKFFTRANTTYINMEFGEEPDLSDAKVVYKGTRYTVSQGKKYAQCHDAKEAKLTYFHRTPKFTLKELLGL
jgi:hypothetical protein